MGLLDYFDEDSPLSGGLFGGGNSSRFVPLTNIPGGDVNAPSAPPPVADVSSMGPSMQGQTSPALPQWLQAAEDPYRSALPMAGLTQAQFNDRFNGETGEPNSARESTVPSAVDNVSHFGDVKFDPQTYAANSGSPSWLQQMTSQAPRSEKPGKTTNANEIAPRKLQARSPQVSNVGSMTGNEIFQGLLRRGYNEIHAAVLTGNILQESGGQPQQAQCEGRSQWSCAMAERSLAGLAGFC